MTCRQCKNLINEYLDGNLGLKSEIMQHIASCPRCEKYYRQMVKINRTLTHQSAQAVPQDFCYSWRNEIQRHPRKKRFQYKILIPALAGALCCVFVITAFATGGFTIHSQNSVMLSGAQEEADMAEHAPAVVENESEQDSGVAGAPQTPQIEEGSELTESTTNSQEGPSSADSAAPPQSQAADKAQVGSGRAAPLDIAPEKIQAGASIDKQTFLQKAAEEKITIQENENSVLLKDDGTGKIDVLLKEFGLSRKNSGLDVEIVFS